MTRMRTAQTPNGAVAERSPVREDDGRDGPPLEAMAILDRIDAREGMSVDHLVRAKLHYLLEQDGTLVKQIQLSDAKAGAVITLMGLLAVNSLDRPTPPESLLLATLYWGLVMGCLGAALWALIPRFPPASIRDRIAERDRFSWTALASDRVTAAGFASFMNESQASQLIASAARSNHAVAQILLKKFQALRLSFQCAAGAIAALGLRAALGF